MTASRKAVFLSYASQDAEAARRIRDALQAEGLEVWFDQSELKGGDSWDASIRRQIKECALFVPVISSTTNSRSEGYFRLEWKLAVERSHLMADDQPFLLPVVIDDTPDSGARVHVGLGDRNRAFELLERAYAQREPSMPSLGSDYMFDPIRDDPRFRDLLKRMKLDAYFPEAPVR